MSANIAARAAITLAGLGGFVTPVLARQITFSRLVDNQTQMPDAPAGRKFLLLGAPSISANRLVFHGEGLDPKGVYEWNAGTLYRVADTTTPVPGSSGTFVNLGAGLGNSGDHVVFTGTNNIVSGLYNRFNGQLGLVAAKGTPAPNGGTFTVTGNPPAVEANTVAFKGLKIQNSVESPGVYRWDSGTLSAVADINTAIPGGMGNFADFFYNTVRLNQGAAMFIGLDANSKAGIYQRLSGGALSVVMDTNTDGPAGMGKFLSVVDFDPWGNDLIMRGATQTGGGGLYTRVGGVWSKIVNTGDPAPGGGTFANIYGLSLVNNIAVFGDGNIGGIYTNLGGTLQRVIGPGDALDGKTVLSAALGGRDGFNLGITVTFTDHAPPVSFDQAIYKVTLPAPPSALIPFGAAAILAARRRR